MVGRQTGDRTKYAEKTNYLLLFRRTINVVLSFVRANVRALPGRKMVFCLRDGVVNNIVNFKTTISSRTLDFGLFGTDLTGYNAVGFACLRSRVSSNGKFSGKRDGRRRRTQLFFETTFPTKKPANCFYPLSFFAANRKNFDSRFRLQNMFLPEDALATCSPTDNFVF